MKNFTLFALYNHKMKFLGISIIIITLLMSVLENVFDFNITPQFSRLLNWFLIFGLFILSYSKEKIDDERVQKSRYFALKGTFMLSISTILAFEFTDIISTIESKPSYLEFTLIVVAVYLILFNLSLYFDWKTIYNNESVSNNISNNAKFYFLYIVISVITVVLFYIST